MAYIKNCLEKATCSIRVAKGCSSLHPKGRKLQGDQSIQEHSPSERREEIFFSVLAKRMTTYLLENNYIDTSCQKAGVPGFPGCVEHSTMIWDQIQKAKRQKTDLHVVWLNLDNAYGSVPHQLINDTLEFCRCVLPSRASLLGGRVSKWKSQWGVPFVKGCHLVAAFEITLIGARQMVGGVRLPSGQR